MTSVKNESKTLYKEKEQRSRTLSKKNNLPVVSRIIQTRKFKFFEEGKNPSSSAPNFLAKKENNFFEISKPFERKIQLPLLKSTKIQNKGKFGSMSKTVPFGERLFIADSDYPDVISCLKSRGWRECQELNKDRCILKFLKNPKLPESIKPNQIINHLSRIDEVSTKVKICRNLKKFPISYDFFPECYIISPKDSADEFIEAFKRNQAESILKLYKENESQVTHDDLIKSLNIIQRKIEEKPIKKGIENYNSLVENFLKVLENDKQYKIRGTKNIWIVKPGFKSRGRDIMLYRSLEEILEYTKNNSWVIQKYIENPLIINKYKFDIRQWVLVTCFSNFEIFFYKQCYLRFSAKEYDLSEINDLYIHLTNNSIAKYSPLFSQNESMWHIDQFRQWLIEKNNDDIWDKSILPKVKNIVLNTIKSAKEKISAKRNTFELLGFDFMIDSDFKPWLIEVNTSPAMDYSTNITKELVQQVLPDTLKVILDYSSDPTASIGGFEKLSQSL
ncbi:TTLL8_1 [Blepharisma stoltei]|uniref:Tubulin-tyrosine ligase n=1 Tax=Blepharisma stoltei TaxID=1481888 RepID=A0AAU9IF60_9CILI|nr:unnamed protein product [Blepharisma stoltei]